MIDYDHLPAGMQTSYHKRKSYYIYYGSSHVEYRPIFSFVYMILVQDEQLGGSAPTEIEPKREKILHTTKLC